MKLLASIILFLTLIFTGCAAEPPPSVSQPPKTSTVAPPPVTVTVTPTPSPSATAKPTPPSATTPTPTPKTEPSPSPTSKPQPTTSTPSPPAPTEALFSIVKPEVLTTVVPINFKVKTAANLPSDSEWAWYWDDGSEVEITNLGEDTVAHQFKKAGVYNITLELRNTATKSVLGKNGTNLVIDDNIILQQMKTLRIAMAGTSWKAVGYSNNKVDKNGVLLWPLIWQGHKASARWEEILPGGGSRNYLIEVEVSDDELTVLSATWISDSLERYPTGVTITGHEKLTVKNIPLNNRALSSLSGKVEGENNVKPNLFYEYDSGRGEVFPGFNWVPDPYGPPKNPRIECELKVGP